MGIVDHIVSRMLSKYISEKIGGTVYITVDRLNVKRNDGETEASAKVAIVVKDSSLEAITQNLQLL